VKPYDGPMVALAIFSIAHGSVSQGVRQAFVSPDSYRIHFR